MYKFWPEHLILDGQMVVAFPEISQPSVYRIVTEGKFMLFDTKFSNSFDNRSRNKYYLEPDLNHSIFDNMDATNTLTQERPNHRNFYRSQSVSKNAKVEIQLANEESGLAFFSTDLGHFFGSNIGNESGVILREKEPRMPMFACDYVGIDSLKICTDLIKYNIADDTKASMLRCSIFISKLLSGVNITKG